MYAPPNASSIAEELHNTARCQIAAVDLHNFLQTTEQVCDRASNHKPSNFKLGVQ